MMMTDCFAPDVHELQFEVVFHAVIPAGGEKMSRTPKFRARTRFLRRGMTLRDVNVRAPCVSNRTHRMRQPPRVGRKSTTFERRYNLSSFPSLPYVEYITTTTTTSTARSLLFRLYFRFLLFYRRPRAVVWLFTRKFRTVWVSFCNTHVE